MAKDWNAETPLEWMVRRLTEWTGRRASARFHTTPIDSAMFEMDEPADEGPDTAVLTANPPSCIADLAPQLGDVEEDRHGAVHVRWSIGCGCGGRSGSLLGHPLSRLAPERLEPGERDPLLSPLAFACEDCGQTTDMLDTDLHGYHAEIGRAEGEPGGSKLRGSGPGTRYACPQCRGEVFTMATRFAYWGLDEIIETIEDLPLKAGDLFNVFDCECVCAGCGHRSHPTDFGKL